MRYRSCYTTLYQRSFGSLVQIPVGIRTPQILSVCKDFR
jgi:hypothetical protein